MLYNDGRLLSMEFYKQPGDRYPRCAWPGCRKPMTSAVDAHHFIVPRNHGRVINAPWNLASLHPGHCHLTLAHGSGREALIRYFYARLGMFIRLQVINLETWEMDVHWQLFPQTIAPEPLDWRAGKAWLQVALQSLYLADDMFVHISLP